VNISSSQQLLHGLMIAEISGLFQKSTKGSTKWKNVDKFF